jgi:hypothetical protein
MPLLLHCFDCFTSLHCLHVPTPQVNMDFQRHQLLAALQLLLFYATSPPQGLHHVGPTLGSVFMADDRAAFSQQPTKCLPPPPPLIAPLLPLCYPSPPSLTSTPSPLLHHPCSITPALSPTLYHPYSITPTPTPLFFTFTIDLLLFMVTLATSQLRLSPSCHRLLWLKHLVSLTHHFQLVKHCTFSCFHPLSAGPSFTTFNTEQVMFPMACAMPLAFPTAFSNLSCSRCHRLPT